MQKVMVWVLLALLTGCAPRSAVQKETMNWKTLPEVEALKKEDPRPVLADLYTTWCGWCKVMDKNTYSNPAVIKYLSEKFHAIKVNAETRENLVWNGKSYPVDQASKTSRLAIEWTNGRLSYPTTIIIPPGEAPQAIPGYLTPAEFEPIVKYFGEGAYKRMSFPDFQKQFKPSWN